MVRTRVLGAVLGVWSLGCGAAESDDAANATDTDADTETGATATSAPSSSSTAGSTTGDPSSTSGNTGTSAGTTADATSSAGSSGESGSSSDDGSEDSGDVETTTVVVSVAHGGQTSRSCDGGRTWGGFHDYGPQDDHNDYAAFGGITFGAGVFVAATGWGAPGHILLSEDGETWTDLPDDAFTNATDGAVERPRYASGVEFAGDHFVMFGDGIWFSDDGRAWERREIPSLEFSGHFREVEYLSEPGVLAVAVDHDGDPQWRIQISADGGETWSWADGVNSDCMGYVQHVGGFAYVGGHMLVGGGGGATCVSDDDGMSWSAADSIGVAFADLKADDQQFLAQGEDGSLRVSTDGTGWVTLAQTGLDGGRIGWVDGLGYFGAASGYAYADEPETWTPVASEVPEGFGGVREFAVGQVASDLACAR